MFDNPYMQYNPYFQQPQIPQQRQEVIKVNGENGARAYTIGANSSALLLDSSGLLVWLVTTDGAGYKSVMAYDITPHQEAPQPDYSTLEQRISRLEGLINERTSNTSATKQPEYATYKEFSTNNEKRKQSSSSITEYDISEKSSDHASN